jgi:hypothetical protein
MAGGPQPGGITTNPNINQLAAQGIAGSGIGSAAGMGYNPNSVTAGQLAGNDMSAYMNPYTQQVIDTNQSDILRGADIGMDALGAQAQGASAFGGARHGIAMGEIGRNTLDQLARSSAGLRQQGYQQAQQAGLSDISNKMAADQFNVQSGLQGAQQRLGAAGQLANISNLGFGMGQQVTNNLAMQGAQQQAMQQALIDSGKSRYEGYVGHPGQGLAYPTAALGASPVPTSTTKSRDPGLFDYLTLAATAAGPIMAASDLRLKTNITRLGKLKSGLNIYQWDWKEGAKEFGADMNHTIGVIAQEVKELFPKAVMKMDNGYYAVDYAQLR